MSTPTEQAYAELQRAYDFFNARLFGGELPPCLMTFQRKNRMYGYFSGERWDSLTGARTDEIAMNPAHFATRSPDEVLSTLVHEMAHLWQHHFGTPSRSAYHNREWAARMDALGLCPSDTGQPGGKRTGQSMSHYVAAGGPFAQACAVLLAEGFALSWRDRAREHAPGKTPGKAGVRTKYTCRGCGLNAWAKAEAVLRCGTCELALAPEAVGEA
jgi:predicted SprT family Zn-dependent metalloprotease